MKRGGPLKRTGSLKRTPLSRGSAPLKRSEGLKRGKPRPKAPRAPDGSERFTLRERVWEADRGRCCSCGLRVGLHAGIWVWQAHHPVPKQTLKARLGEAGRRLAGATESAMLLCKRCHERHETAAERVPLSKVPGRCREMAARLGHWAEDVLVLRHPDVTQNQTEEV